MTDGANKSLEGDPDAEALMGMDPMEYSTRRVR
jgi:hypothetical protein